MQYDAIIIGAGLAGLACAKVLEKHHLSYTVLEADDQPGGRIQTDRVDGFQLDHGFQVLQTGYPDIGQYLNLNDLQLKSFPAGVAVRFNGRFHTIADPRKHPRHLFSTLASPLGNIGDRVAMLKLAHQVCRGTIEDIFNQPEEMTIDYLKNYGFSQKFIKSFFMPFLAGACLDKNINVSNRVLKYLFRIFATGDATLPSKGMGEIPKQLAGSLPAGKIQLQSKVVEISDGSVKLEDGREISGKQIIVATPEPAVHDLLDIQEVKQSVAESCIYYSTNWSPPFKEPFLLLNGDSNGPVNNIAFPSMVAPEYAPKGKTLIAVVVVDDRFIKGTTLEDDVRRQCHEWFGSIAYKWEHIRTYQIEHALPAQVPPTKSPYILPKPFNDKVRICGEHQSLPGLQWSLMSGHMTGEDVAKSM